MQESEANDWMVFSELPQPVLNNRPCLKAVRSVSCNRFTVGCGARPSTRIEVDAFIRERSLMAKGQLHRVWSRFRLPHEP